MESSFELIPLDTGKNVKVWRGNHASGLGVSMVTKEETKYELKVLQNLNREWLERAEEHRRRIDFTRGIALGLIYGIIGNLFVQFFYAVVESLVLKKYDGFVENAIISVVALLVILYVTIRFRGQLMEEEAKEKTAEQHAETTRKALQTREHRLENEDSAETL